MGKTRDLFKKIRDTTGTFHAKMSSIKDRNGMDLTEAEDIKKRWQEHMEELYKKDLYDPTDCSPPDFSILGILQARILECAKSRTRLSDFPFFGGFLCCRPGSERGGLARRSR